MNIIVFQMISKTEGLFSQALPICLITKNIMIKVIYNNILYLIWIVVKTLISQHVTSVLKNGEIYLEKSFV